MCGRFTLTVGSAGMVDYFPKKWLADDGLQLMASYNIVPGSMVGAIINEAIPRLRPLHWGVIPFWRKGVKERAGLINARSETAAEKPTFRRAFRRRRCLIPADGFYEWQVMRSGRKQPVYVRFKAGGVFAFAGLWACNSSAGGGERDELYRCTILTTTPNELLEPIHNRMPVILPSSAFEAWLDPGESDPFVLQQMMRPYPASEMSAYVVDCTVNNPRNNSPACISRVQ